MTTIWLENSWNYLTSVRQKDYQQNIKVARSYFSKLYLRRHIYNPTRKTRINIQFSYNATKIMKLCLHTDREKNEITHKAIRTFFNRICHDQQKQNFGITYDNYYIEWLLPCPRQEKSQTFVRRSIKLQVNSCNNDCIQTEEFIQTFVRDDFTE